MRVDKYRCAGDGVEYRVGRTAAGYELSCLVDGCETRYEITEDEYDTFCCWTRKVYERIFLREPLTV